MKVGKINIPARIFERPFIQQLICCPKRIQDDDLGASDIDVDDFRIWSRREPSY